MNKIFRNLFDRKTIHCLGGLDRAGVKIAVPPVASDVSSQDVSLGGAPGLVEACSDTGAVGLTLVAEGKDTRQSRFLTTGNIVSYSKYKASRITPKTRSVYVVVFVNLIHLISLSVFV